MSEIVCSYYHPFNLRSELAAKLEGRYLPLFLVLPPSLLTVLLNGCGGVMTETRHVPWEGQLVSAGCSSWGRLWKGRALPAAVGFVIHLPSTNSF